MWRDKKYVERKIREFLIRVCLEYPDAWICRKSEEDRH